LLILNKFSVDACWISVIIFIMSSSLFPTKVARKFRGYIWVLVLAMLVINCNKPVKNKDYFPHSNGDWWKYRVSNISGYVIKEFSGTTHSGNITYQNWLKTYYDTLAQPISQETNYVLVRDTMVLFFEDLDSDPWVYLRFPLGVDSAWTFYIDEELVTARVISLEENFSVEEREFEDVYQIRYDNRESEESRLIYYAPGVGIIKYSEYSDNELDYDEELLEYKVK